MRTVPIPPMTDAQIQRFWTKVDKKGSDECWEFKAFKNKDGYGQHGINSGVYLAHKVAFSLAIASVPNGMLVIHSCDNPPCCNPHHLSIGTQFDNMTDMAKKSRSTRGEKSWDAKLNAEQVLEIRRRHAAGEAGYRKLGQEYGVDRTNIRDIVRRILWKHI